MAVLKKPRAIAQIFKAVRALAGTAGKRQRWKLSDTVPGLLAATACEQIVVHGLTWPGVILAAVSVTPLTVSQIAGICRQNYKPAKVNRRKKPGPKYSPRLFSRHERPKPSPFRRFSGQ